MGRLLDSGVLGQRGKHVPHIAVTVSLDTLHDLPGALPATGASGQRLPNALVRRWLCDSALTRYVLDLGHRVVENSHTARRSPTTNADGSTCRPAAGARPRDAHPDPTGRCSRTTSNPGPDATPPASTTPLCCAPAATTTFTSAGRPCAYATADASMNTDRSTSYLTRPAHRAPHRPHSFARYSLVRYSFSCAGKLP